MSDSENMADELLALIGMTSPGPEREGFLERYRAIVGDEPLSFPEGFHIEPITAEPVIEFSINTRDCEPMSPETLGALASVMKQVYQNFTREDQSRIPCPRCGQLAELRSPAGRREEWECTSCGFGFDLPADPIE